jgi:uncharacterized repeat protein (TIGR01451 family)
VSYGRATGLFARRIALAISTVAVVIGGLLLGGMPANADPVLLQPGELIVNGGAEQPVSIGWTGTGSRATHGSGGYPDSVIVNSAGATGATFAGGTALFTGASVATSLLSQTIDLTPSAAAIDNGHVDALVSAYVGGYANQHDDAAVKYNFQNAGGTSLAAVTFGPVLFSDRGNVSGFVPFSQTQLLPVGTRKVVVTITTARVTAPANDGYADNISLVLDAPSPMAAADSTTTPENTAISVPVLGNDIAGVGATLVPSSVRLLDGTTEVTTLATADGSYQVDTTTGRVLFTPVTGFVGSTPPVPYRVTDSSGQDADSTVVIQVTLVAAPALTLVKSASPSDPAAFLAGTPITYSFVVTNTGNVAMNNIAIDDSTFSGENPMSTPVCPQPTLAAGAQEVCTANYTLTVADVNSGSVSNTATATGVAQGSLVTTVTTPSSFGVPISAAPSMTLVKSVSPTTANHAGDSVTYSFVVTNTGNVSLHGVAISEGAFSGTAGVPAVTCPPSAILPGQALTCTAPYALSQADVDAGSVSNTATASSLDPNGATVVSSAASATLTLTPQPAVTFEKTASRSTITAVGQAVRYSFAITNSGNLTLSVPTVNEGVFTGSGALGTVTCPASPASLAPAQTLTCTASYVTTAADLLGGTIENTATATVTTPTGGTLTSDPSTSTVTVDLATSAPAGGPTLATTGTDPAPLGTVGLALTLLGAGLLMWVVVVRRRRLS